MAARRGDRRDFSLSSCACGKRTANGPWPGQQGAPPAARRQTAEQRVSRRAAAPQWPMRRLPSPRAQPLPRQRPTPSSTQALAPSCAGRRRAPKAREARPGERGSSRGQASISSLAGWQRGPRTAQHREVGPLQACRTHHGCGNPQGSAWMRRSTDQPELPTRATETTDVLVLVAFDSDCLPRGKDCGPPPPSQSRDVGRQTAHAPDCFHRLSS